jgi:hypothetical protein
MSLYKTITLTEKGAKAGPSYDIYWSADGTIFTFLQTAVLSSIGSTINITLPNNARVIRLTSIGNCSNSVTEGIPGVTLGDFTIDFDQLDFN